MTAPKPTSERVSEALADPVAVMGKVPPYIGPDPEIDTGLRLATATGGGCPAELYVALLRSLTQVATRQGYDLVLASGDDGGARLMARKL